MTRCEFWTIHARSTCHKRTRPRDDDDDDDDDITTTLSPSLRIVSMLLRFSAHNRFTTEHAKRISAKTLRRETLTMRFFSRRLFFVLVVVVVVVSNGASLIVVVYVTVLLLLLIVLRRRFTSSSYTTNE